MESVLVNGFKGNNEILFIALTVLVAACTALAVFAVCFYWFRREQRRWQKKFLKAIAESDAQSRGTDPDRQR